MGNHLFLKHVILKIVQLIASGATGNQDSVPKRAVEDSEQTREQNW